MLGNELSAVMARLHEASEDWQSCRILINSELYLHSAYCLEEGVYRV